MPGPRLNGPHGGVGVGVAHLQDSSVGVRIPCQSKGFSIPYSRRHIEVWELVSPTQGAKLKRASRYALLNRPKCSVWVCIPT